MVGDDVEDEEGAWSLLTVPLCCHHHHVQPVQLVLPSSREEEAGGGENWDRSLHFVIRVENERG